ncbi:translation elongation factor Ts [bacterium]|nr:translation elongation factor Ts [bacterium]
MSVSASEVKALRDKTGAGMMKCKEALKESNGDIEKAIEYLRKKGMASAAKRAGRDTTEGAIISYIHPGNRIGVMIEMNCETDFVAKTENYLSLAREIAMQIAATNPMAVNREQVPTDLLEKELDIYRGQARDQGKPEKVIEKIVTGKIEKYYQENVLNEQPFVKDTSKTIKEYILENSSKLGEAISIRRFARFQLGEEL